MSASELKKNHPPTTALALNFLTKNIEQHSLPSHEVSDLARYLITYFESDDQIPELTYPSNLDLTEDILNQVRFVYFKRGVHQGLTKKALSRISRNYQEIRAVLKATHDFKEWEPTGLHQKKQLLQSYLALTTINKGLAATIFPSAAVLGEKIPTETFKPIIFAYVATVVCSTYYEVKSLRATGYAVNTLATALNLALPSWASSVLPKLTLAPYALVFKAALEGSKASEHALIAQLSWMIAWHILIDIRLNVGHMNYQTEQNVDTENQLELLETEAFYE